MHLDGPVRVFEALAVAKRVLEENLVFTHVHSNRRESGQIAIQRRRPRVARVSTLPSCTCRWLKAFAMESPPAQTLMWPSNATGCWT
jgi:hypothetical protein